MVIYEAAPDDAVFDRLIAFSRDWEAERSCYGYRANEREDIVGNRVFLAEEDGAVLGYLFGKRSEAKNMTSIMPEGTPFFEVMELYVVPARRSEGVGHALFRYVENAVQPELDYLLLSTATKNWRAILHFYIDMVGMDFWSATLFKKLN